MSTGVTEQEKIGKRIRRFREAAGLTQKDLGAALKWGDRAQVRISHYELGRRAVRIEDIQQIARALKCSVGDLLGDANGVLPPQNAEPVDLDERKQIVRMFATLSEGRRAAAIEYMRQLARDEDEERAKLAADLKHIGKLSTPRVAELVATLARAVSERTLRDADAATIKSLIRSLSGDRQE